MFPTFDPHQELFAGNHEPTVRNLAWWNMHCSCASDNVKAVKAINGLHEPELLHAHGPQTFILPPVSSPCHLALGPLVVGTISTGIGARGGTGTTIIKYGHPFKDAGRMLLRNITQEKDLESWKTITRTLPDQPQIMIEGHLRSVKIEESSITKRSHR